jgi:hypothetical protein
MIPETDHASPDLRCTLYVQMKNWTECECLSQVKAKDYI